MEVVILAGGIGRRFGGIKQLAPVSPEGATLLEVTLRDACHAGCRQAVVVTAPEMADAMRSLFEERPIAGLALTVAIQDPDDLPAPRTGVTLARLWRDAQRQRPWGTAHALWAARHHVQGPFLLFNADDHYGPRAPAALLRALAEPGSGPAFALLGFPLGTTLSSQGTVSRAICEVDRLGRLVALREHPAIDQAGRAGGLSLPLTAPVSMNAWAFTSAIFPLLESSLINFLATADLETDECYLPVVVDAAVEAGDVEVRVVTAPDRWCGMTWPEDRQRVARELARREEPRRLAGAFDLEIDDAPAQPFGHGLIHTTWRVATAQGPHLLQRLNDRVFARPAEVAENAAAAATRVDHALRQFGEHDPRKRLRFRTGPDQRPWTRTDDGAVWRAMALIDGSRPADPARPGEVRAAARLLGRFPGLVATGAGPEPRAILPGFHDPPARLSALRRSAEVDPHGRLAGCREEVHRLIDLAPLASCLSELGLPTRFVHNDAKLDNVLVDAGTGEPLCVVDLDTVMPGLAAHDFGDLVRSSVSGRPEDEPRLDLIVVHRHIFEDLTTGYLEGAAAWIDDVERAGLLDGALVITYEQAVRFLTDHLNGDAYYPVDDDRHNLRRARAQIRLLAELQHLEADLRRIAL